ncbi:MAG: nicotinamide riboside transporter PnuC [Prevotellaceae bacterium]|jgi:nicotinamide mononucleotide transporter|nr:nicotinamide riboside transporter PnuC [Prevotellaceae bacterium]
MTSVIISYIQANWIEIVGSVLSLVYLYLSVHQKISLWLFGLLSAVFYVVIFYDSKFYADMSLQFYYVFVSIYGWVNWKKGKDKVSKLPVVETPRKQYAYLIIASALIFIAYYFLLVNYTDSPLPKADSLTTALSIVATWMLAKKYIEYWLVFIFVDAFSAGLYFYKDLYPTAVLFIIYTVMAIVGYVEWKKDLVK